MTPAQSHRRSLAPGAPLGKHVVIRQLAVGGMAELYLTRTTGMEGFEKLVCVKRILPQHVEDPTFVAMFVNEARLAATFHHHNIAQIYDIGQEPGAYFFSMEYVHGEDLGAVIASGRDQGVPLSLDCALTIAAGLCAGLHHVHEKTGGDGKPLGVVHRDVSPTNVMISYDGAVKLIDFGIAQASHEPSVTTLDRGLKGRISHMSPEQCRGRVALDRRSDVFSLGTILYELTTGRLPFIDDTEYGVLHQIVNCDAERPTKLVPSYPPALEEIVMRALARDPARRYATTLELQNHLDTFAYNSQLRISPLVLSRLMSTLFPTRLEEWDDARAQGAFFVEEHVVRTLDESGKTADRAARYTPPQVPVSPERGEAVETGRTLVTASMDPTEQTQLSPASMTMTPPQPLPHVPPPAAASGAAAPRTMSTLAMPPVPTTTAPTRGATGPASAPAGASGPARSVPTLAMPPVAKASVPNVPRVPSTATAPTAASPTAASPTAASPTAASSSSSAASSSGSASPAASPSATSPPRVVATLMMPPVATSSPAAPGSAPAHLHPTKPGAKPSPAAPQPRATPTAMSSQEARATPAAMPAQSPPSTPAPTSADDARTTPVAMPAQSPPRATPTAMSAQEVRTTPTAMPAQSPPRATPTAMSAQEVRTTPTSMRAQSPHPASITGRGATRPAPVPNMPGAVPIVRALPAPPVPSGGTLVSSATQAGPPPPMVLPLQPSNSLASIAPYSPSNVTGSYPGPDGSQPGAPGYSAFAAGAPADEPTDSGRAAGRASHSPRGAGLPAFRGSDESGADDFGRETAHHTVADLTERVRVASARKTENVRIQRPSRRPALVLALFGIAGAGVGVWFALQTSPEPRHRSQRTPVKAMSPTGAASPIDPAAAPVTPPAPTTTAAPSPTTTAAPSPTTTAAPSPTTTAASSPTPAPPAGVATPDPAPAAITSPDPAPPVETPSPAKTPPAAVTTPSPTKATTTPVPPPTKAPKQVVQAPRPKAAKPRPVRAAPKRPVRAPKAESKEQPWNNDSPFLPEPTPKR